MERPATPAPSLAAELRQAHQRLREAYRELHQDREAARRVHDHLRVTDLPEMPGVRVAVHHRSCGRHGSDSHEVTRLGAHDLGFYLADVMGRGVSASLLSLFLRCRLQSLAGTPNVALKRLNGELLALELPDAPFLTAVHGRLDCHTGTLQLARAGHPPPLYLPVTGPGEWIQSSGGLLGLFAADPVLYTRQMSAGDKLLVYSDGLVPGDEKPAGSERLLIAALELRACPVDEFVAGLARKLVAQSSAIDDVTLLGIEYAPAN
jgi:sigma-B regulation protein RsbU (phosphoserine phosphatase)